MKEHSEMHGPRASDGMAAADGFVRNDADKHANAAFSLVRAFGCAGSGIAYAFRTQRNMRIHALVAVAALVLGVALRIDTTSWAVIIVCIAVVFAAECVNTAVESVVDLVSPEYAELAGRAKDCAAGAVLVCALGALGVAAFVFLPRILALFIG